MDLLPIKIKPKPYLYQPYNLPHATRQTTKIQTKKEHKTKKTTKNEILK